MQEKKRAGVARFFCLFLIDSNNILLVQKDHL